MSEHKPSLRTFDALRLWRRRCKECIGFILRRRHGYEAFDSDARSLGIFHDMQAAADAVSAAAQQTKPAVV